MATITNDTFLDNGTARTAAESWTCNGGRLTIRTDSRWHSNSPASMTGSLGSVTISSTLGGGYTIDGTRVRWLAITGGSGSPSIGDTVSQGGVYGYYLGFWSSLTAAPSTTIGATGFIKLREVSGGTFTAGTLTFSGAGAATASGSDVVGWIEVVHRQAAAITVPRLGDFTVRGDWFVLGTTTGSANQLIQVPTNGSPTTYVPGVWISTTDTPTTDADYEFYPALYAAGMTTTNLGTDERSKFVCMETDGQIRIGHNGTTTVGYVPPSGRTVRIPNVFGRQTNTTVGDDTNAIPHATAASRPDFTTTSAGAIDIENFATDWYLNFLQPYSVTIRNSVTFDYILLAEVATAIDLDNTGTGTSQSLDSRSFNATSCFAGGTINNCSFQRFQAGSNDHCFEIMYCKDIIISNTKAGIITYARSTGMAYQVTQSYGIIFNNCYAFNRSVQFTTSFDCELNNLDYCDRYVGTTNTTGIYAVYILASSDNILVDGMTFGLQGTVSDVHPYLGIFNIGQSANIKVRNIGSRSAFLSGGSTNNPAYIFLSGGNNNTIKFQRIYMSPTRTGAISTLNSDKNMVYEHVYGDMGDTMVVADLNSIVKNCGGTNTVTGQASVYGTHFWDAFTSDTTGRVILSLNEPTAETNSLVTIVAGTPKFTSAGNLVLATEGDEVIIESGYYVLGCTGLTNTAPVVTGTNVTYSSGSRWGNHDIYYQIDTGSGYGGTWKDLTATNLSGENISASTGFKLKYRLVCATTSTTNLLTYIRIATDSTLTSQTDNLYPLEVVPVTITVVDKYNNPIENAQTAVYRSDTDIQLMNENTNVNGVATENVEYSGNTAIYIRVRKSSDGFTRYYPASTVGTLTTTGYATTIAMVEDTTV